MRTSLGLLKSLRLRRPGEKLYVVLDSFSPHKYADELEPGLPPREIFLLWQAHRTHSPLAARATEQSCRHPGQPSIGTQPTVRMTQFLRARRPV
ncbi:hypothetical protein [Streptomyces sp. SID12501]|uniref:hypothetical protein n=1 Tax=Streptomyces sp. SID12501 TaxID=2706042 RepID=UPI001EF1D607|nr:hypothetical protein [Streptomyces sp. SID12501]